MNVSSFELMVIVYSAENDPRPQMIPRPETDDAQTGSQMIPDWTANDPHRKTRNGMEFGFLECFPFKFIHFHELNDK